MKTAFTLIELLVVITIIVVLLALLVPALDKAIYQAELAVCAAQVRGIVSSGMIYAAEQKRHYPAPAEGRRPTHQPDELGQGESPARDMRRILKDYVPLKAHLCPLTAGQIDVSEEANSPDTFVYSTYQLWFGMAYNPANGGRGAMRKIGDRFGWEDPQDQLNRFNLLVSDVNIYHTTAFNTQSGHPDRAGVAVPAVYQDQSAAEAFVVGAGALPVLRLTVSRWVSDGGIRGFLDQSYGFDDGAVNILRDIEEPDHQSLTIRRFKRVPSHQGGPNAYRIFIPPVAQ